MTHGKERSSLFKFFYTVLRVITFPIFAVLYVLQHPLWVAFLLLVLCGVAVYYPLQSGVKLDEVPEWYKKKYTEVKYEVVAKAVENGDTTLFSQDMLEELADEVEADKGLKSENYNAKVSKDKTIENVTSGLKKRGGFKRKGEPTEQSAEEKKPEEGVSTPEENTAAGGLEALLSNKQETEAVAAEELVEAGKAAVSENKPLLPQPEVPAQTAPAQGAVSNTEDEFDLF